MKLPAFTRKPANQRTVRQVGQFCVREMGVKWSAAIIHRKNHHGTVWARQVAQYLCRETLGARYEQIGLAFERHHAAVMYNCRVVEGYMEVYPELRLEIDAIKQKVMKRFGIARPLSLFHKAA
jgi:chromosomal replication initiation ATPase DnaA